MYIINNHMIFISKSSFNYRFIIYLYHFFLVLGNLTFLKTIIAAIEI